MFPSYSSAAKHVPCSVFAFTQAVKRGNRHIKGKRFWFDGEEVPPIYLGRIGKRCIIDGVIYTSVGAAAKLLGSKPCALKLALDIKTSFKGHRISWANSIE